ncbi:SDR family oxidoreductase [Streptomyces ipomoeae]|uniref:SDR family oxidoreductase n=1 Tax=Streptomyces ipomoeae TaxID=103232 RepID=UPI0011467286|nr:SDR family oxidoreductase [Streptomyces ipomoeae]MDX2935531.1 SDR family oxidoreductase [Streptomyces ipomoeae]TQE18358.1 SDR family oxidoreductase [Streptomyces ipomoeae]
MTTGRSLFITGAAKGIGRETVLLFARRGWRVGAIDISQDGLDALAKELGHEHFYRQVDVTDADSVGAALAAFADTTGGSIDLLVNNAGLIDMAHFEDIPLARQHAVTNVNVLGVLNSAHEALPYLRKSPRATMVNLCSAASDYGVPSEAVYSASKFWVKGFTEALNIEWARHGIHVCSVMPNFVATDMTADQSGKLIDAVGIKLTAADVARAIHRAVEKRGGKPHHWVDTTWGTFLRGALGLLPARGRRALMRRVSGY